MFTESAPSTTMSGIHKMTHPVLPEQRSTSTCPTTTLDESSLIFLSTSDLMPPCEGEDCEADAVAAIKFKSHGNHLNRHFLSCRDHTQEAQDPGFFCPTDNLICVVEDIQWL